jgi:integrase
MRYPERKRERFLTELEISRLGEVLAAVEADESEDIYAIAAIRLLLLTGCRLDEIRSARREWVDFQRGVLNLPDSKTGQKVVHLNGAALEVLKAIPCVEGNPYLIVGRIKGTHWVNLSKVWTRIRTKAGIQPTTLANGKVEHVRIHDLRHSFASLSAANGASLIMIGKLLGHTNPSTTARYAHLVDDHVKRVNNEVGERVGAAFNLRPVPVS